MSKKMSILMSSRLEWRDLFIKDNQGIPRPRSE